jgi:hypothetical protein
LSNINQRNQIGQGLAKNANPLFLLHFLGAKKFNDFKDLAGLAILAISPFLAF